MGGCFCDMVEAGWRKPMSKERQPVSIEIFDLTDVGEFEWTPSEFIKWVTDAIADVPEEFRESVRICGKEEYGECDSWTVVTANYTRPETDVEFMTRIENTSMWARQKDMQDLALYQRLKAKFG